MGCKTSSRRGMGTSGGGCGRENLQLPDFQNRTLLTVYQQHLRTERSFFSIFISAPLRHAPQFYGVVGVLPGKGRNGGYQNLTQILISEVRSRAEANGSP